jgi:3',5'-cyclic AMP phosphodiesterase CpdA
MVGGSLVHLADLHFGGRVDLAQIEALEGLVPALAPRAVVIAGDLAQRARHGEFQRALAFVQAMQRVAPTLVVPGNHDVSWWASPFGLRGDGPKYAKYRRYFGEVLGRVIRLPDVVLVGTVSAHGLAAGSMTWNPRDLTVKGHLPPSETDRARAAFLEAPAGALRVVVLHHNVVRGQISHRWGLAHPMDAQRRLVETGADLVLCGHDHQEGVARLDGPADRSVVVATASTHTAMTRGRRPPAFNVVEWDESRIVVRHLPWAARAARFEDGPAQEFARSAPAAFPRRDASRDPSLSLPAGSG